ncbi:MAG: GTPase ObgE [Planctomycetota bacterium]
MFRDECELEVRAGKGGDGAVSFRREKFAPFGGPDGGDGGDGGSVVLVASTSVNSLLAIGRRPIHEAEDGKGGGPRNRSGKKAEDLELEVPVGTQIFDAAGGHLLRDLLRPGERCIIAAGGRGGRGNKAFASSVQQAPRKFEHGTAGEGRRVRLELKLIAEVGLLGLPNAGKSTFLASISQATPKIADYPFTTLVPHVGIAAVGNESLVVADLPGLIEGAAEGAGLGHRFLKHVERCSVLLHLVDVSEEATSTPLAALEVVERELEQYSPELHRRPRLVVATKCEDEAAEERATALELALGRPLFRISSVTRDGVPALLGAALQTVKAARPV